MYELTNSVTQTIAPGATATFDTVIVCTGRDVSHRNGSGLMQLNGRGNCCHALYNVSMSGNIGGGAGTQANIAIALNGEALPETVRVATITASTDVFPFAASTTVVENGCGCGCGTVTVKNVGTTPITLSNPDFKAYRTR